MITLIIGLEVCWARPGHIPTRARPEKNFRLRVGLKSEIFKKIKFEPDWAGMSQPDWVGPNKNLND